MRTGLVLEGGAMRGMFTCGITDVMMENGLAFDGAMGVSAGAIFGCNYKSGQPGRAIRYNLACCGDKRYGTLRSLLKTGDLYDADFCYRQIPDELDWFDTDTFEKNPMEFWVVATDVLTGKAVYHKCTDGKREDVTWIRASGSMPLAAKPVEVGGYTMLDGGIADSVPLRKMEELGYGRNVVVLTQPMGYVKGQNKALPLMKMALRKYPAFLRTAENRPAMYNETLRYIREKERAGEVFVIRPEGPLDIGKTEHDPERLKAVYAQGRAVMEKRLAALREFLQ